MIHAGAGSLRLLVGVALVLAISACTGPRPRRNTPVAPGPALVVAPAPIERIEPLPAQQQRGSLQPSPVWQRLRTRFALDGCAYSDAVLREARRYTRSSQHFSASWQAAMPSLLLVLQEIERHDLPGEFALLPYVESNYRSLPARGKGPAGIWQLMGRTAVDHGLKVGRDYDQRLDLLASTEVALTLLERYDREFSDWRLASMAFNAGEYRLKRALRGATTTLLDAQRLAQLDLSSTTHQHLIRLLALSCIVAEPERFGVALPQASAEDLLVQVTPAAAIDLRLAASLAGVDLESMLRFNMAWAGQSSPHGPANRLLLPAVAADRLQLALTDFPVSLLGAWHVRRIDIAGTPAELAARLDITAEVLAQANRLDVDAPLTSGRLLLLPGAD
ncbi:MAG: transglycosylase SLT domain-containing protein, partial [Dokdonella sp.]|uniref:transglycosylase SLT domain-containing protein n=1 Tax=Dokdonella sp. TaxID=2291710 RepID=UPI003BB03B87